MSLLGNVMAWSIYLAVAGAATSAVILALLILRERSLVYGSFMLAGVGVSVAGLISVLGYQVIAAAQLIVYVGASVMFFIISLSMMGNLKVKSTPLYISLSAGLIASAVFYYLITIVTEELGYEVGPTTITASTLSRFLAGEFTLQLSIIVTALAFTSIFAIYFAKRRGKKG